MASETVPGVQTVEGMTAGLDALKTALLTGMKAHLYKSSFAPNPESPVADFVAAEADFTGYAASVLTWSAIGIDANGLPVCVSARAFFQATDNVTPNDIGGVWISREAAGPPALHDPIEFYPFAGAKPMHVALAFLGVVVAFGLPGQNGYVSVDS